jgi:hypothetical protein
MSSETLPQTTLLLYKKDGQINTLKAKFPDAVERMTDSRKVPAAL